MRARLWVVVVAVGVSSCAQSSARVGSDATLPPAVLEQLPSPGPQSDERLPAVPRSAIAADVASVTDGDTVVLRGIDVGEIHRATGGRKARLIGVDTPEVYGQQECFGRAASSFTRDELEGTRVHVAFDVGRTDRYGRALVYLWDEHGRFFNGRLVQEGFAQQMTVPPNVTYAALLGTLAQQARIARRGLWSAC